MKTSLLEEQQFMLRMRLSLVRTRSSRFAGGGHAYSLVATSVRLAISSLDQIPEIPVEIGEDSHGAIVFFLWLANKGHVSRLEHAVVAPEIVGMEKEEDASAGLISDAA